LTLVLGYRSVREMLHSLTGKELTYWQVYERINGPLDNSWRDGQLAAFNELLQYNTYITGQVGQGKKNPAAKPKPVTRPWEMYSKAKEEGNNSRTVYDGHGEVVLDEGEVNPF